MGWTDWGEVGERKFDFYFSVVHLLCEGENCLRFVIDITKNQASSSSNFPSSPTSSFTAPSSPTHPYLLHLWSHSCTHLALWPQLLFLLACAITWLLDLFILFSVNAVIFIFVSYSDFIVYNFTNTFAHILNTLGPLF